MTDKPAIKQTLVEHSAGRVKLAFSARDDTFFGSVTEVRVRAGKPIIFRKNGADVICGELIPDKADITATLEILSNYSLYAFNEEIKNGFLTIAGGHRVGLAGQAVVEGGEVKTLKNICSLNYRISREIKGCAANIHPFAANPLQSVLIISPPARGKTTLLRDLTRLVSDGGANVTVIDERGEIAACHMGIPQNDVGLRTDVIDLCPKAIGLNMALRALSPQVIAMDELAGKREVKAAYAAANAGISLFCSAHGSTVEEAVRRAGLSPLIKHGVFGRYVLMSASGEIGAEKIFDGGLNEIWRR